MVHRPAWLVPLVPTLLITCSLAGCYKTIEVKSILEDRPRHLRAHFSADHIPFAVNPYLPPEGVHRRHAKRLVVTYAAIIRDKPIEVTCTTVYMERGVVTTDCEFGHGEFPISADFEISYLGLLRLRGETVSYGQTYAGPIIELREVSVFPWKLIEGTPGASYQLKGSIGLAGGEGTLVAIDVAIKTKQAIPAARLVQGLSGQAIEVEVEQPNINGLLTVRETHFYLVDYGVSLRASEQHAYGTDSYKIQRISIQ